MAFRIIQFPRSRKQAIAIGSDVSLLVIQFRCFDIQIPTSRDRSVLVVHPCLRSESDIAIGQNTAVLICDGAIRRNGKMSLACYHGLVHHIARVNLCMAFGADGLRIRQRAFRGDRQMSARRDSALIQYVLCANRRSILRMDDARVVQISLDVDYKVLRLDSILKLCRNVFFIQNEKDPSCIHGTKICGIDGDLRFQPAAFDGRYCTTFSINDIRARRHLKRLCFDLPQDLCCAGIQFDGIGLLPIETFTVDHNHRIIRDANIFPLIVPTILRLARGEYGATGIDEAAAIHGDAVRICDHYIGLRTCHFEKAVHRRGMAACHLIQDDLRRAACHIRIALYKACEFCFREGIGVI